MIHSVLISHGSCRFGCKLRLVGRFREVMPSHLLIRSMLTTQSSRWFQVKLLWGASQFQVKAKFCRANLLNSSRAGETLIVDRTSRLKCHQDSSTASFPHERSVMLLLASVDNYDFPPRVSVLHVPNGLGGAAEGEGPVNDRSELAQLVQGAQDIQIRI
jgi:hypothetical protein